MSDNKKTGHCCYETEFLTWLRHNKIITAEEKDYMILQLASGQEFENLLPGLLPASEFLKHKSNFLGIPLADLGRTEIDPSLLMSVPEKLARKYNLVPWEIQDGRLFLAMADPTNQRAVEDISLCSGYQAVPLLAPTEEVKALIHKMYTNQYKEEDPSNVWTESVNIWRMDDSDDQEEPAVRLVGSLLHQAVLEKASDVHWEPTENSFPVKFRIDGRLEIRTVLEYSMARSIAARLKVMAGMDVTERRIPQDGRIILEIPGKKIDIRVSTLNTIYGEKVVTRILDNDTAGLSLAELGMRNEVEHGVRKLLQNPYGLIMVAGPTGSGKTTTLYALLRELNSESQNIISIEDPVEYRLPGVNQAQVNTKIGLDFALGLRAILRQDPDVIMVGEIRDRETARIATTAALTGHLVLTTIHTNTAAEALTRMLDMEIEPYLFASSVCGIISQRLVRRLCPFCRMKYPVPPEMKEAFKWESVDHIYAPGGCSKCRGTGYSGRTGIHEYLPYDQQIKELVLKKSNSVEIEKMARNLGVTSLQDDALLKVSEGVTSLEEVLWVRRGRLNDILEMEGT